VNGRTSIEQYLNFLGELTGMDGERYLITEESERPPVWSFAYEGFVEEGNLTAFTYGLSSVEHPKWKQGKPELVISVDSVDKAWAFAAGFLVKRLRGQHSFTYGSLIRFGQRVTADSPMTAFLVFAPGVLDEGERQLKLVDRSINFAQLYPIYEEEIGVIERVGIDRWFSGGYDPYSVTRNRRNVR
jgi:Suppressor of fused protein (SUFU)